MLHINSTNSNNHPDPPKQTAPIVFRPMPNPYKIVIPR